MIIFMEKGIEKEAASKLALDIIAGWGFEIRVKRSHNGDGVVLAALGVVSKKEDVLAISRMAGVKECQPGNRFYKENIWDFQDAHDFFSWGY